MKLLNSNFNLENIYLKNDMETGLIAIIAIHNTKMGPALGGCRFVNYTSLDEAITDAMKLAKAMTYKSSMAGLPLGGGKSVIISHQGIRDRRRLFEKFGDFVEKLNGEYITASDSGTNEDDMKIIATRTNHVTSINKNKEKTDDTAFMTALGVVKAIEAAVAYKLDKNKLEDIHVAIQGVGSVGFIITKMLIEQGARVTVCDKNKTLLSQRLNEIQVATVDPEQITKIECDVFSPCALGGVINQSVIKNMKASIICGAANNQLDDMGLAEELREKNILFVPDYVANAGGVICAAAQADIITKKESYRKVNNIYDTVINILNISNNLKVATNIIANEMAEGRFLT